MLKLYEKNEWAEEPDKRDLGIWLHDLLFQFHRDRATLEGESSEQKLLNLTDAMFETILKDTPIALGHYIEWRETIPKYIAWLEGHEKEGWQFSVGEVNHRIELNHPMLEKPVTLYGRIDRIDQNSEGQQQVIDYKTKGAQSLKSQLKKNDEVQLPFYYLLLDGELDSAHYLPVLDRKSAGCESVSVDDLSMRGQDLRTLLATSLQQIDQGAGLPANGEDSACKYCAMNGVCRKGAW